MLQAPPTKCFGEKSFVNQMTSVIDSLKINRNSCRFDPSGSTSGRASSIINFSLPANTIIDLQTLALCFDATASANGQANTFARFPNNMNSLIERIDLTINGQIVSSYSGYKELSHLKNILQDTSDFRSRALLNHEYIVGKDSPLNMDDGDDMTTSVDENYSGRYFSATYTQPSPAFCIKKFFGFLHESSIKYLDTSILGSVVVRLTLSTDAVLVSGFTVDLGATGGTGCTYQLQNIFMVADCIQLVEPKPYNDYINQRLSNGGHITINFKNYTTTTSTTSTTRLSVSSQSIDNLYWTARADSYSTQGAPVAVPLPQKEIMTGSIAAYQDLLVKLVGKYFCFSNRGVTQFSWKINSNLVPMYKVNMLLAYKNLLQNSHSTSLIQSFQQYIKTHFVSVTKLNAGDMVNEISGFNSSGTNSSIELVLDGLLANSEVFIAVETTSSLNIFANKEITVDL